MPAVLTQLNVGVSEVGLLQRLFVGWANIFTDNKVKIIKNKTVFRLVACNMVLRILEFKNNIYYILFTGISARLFIVKTRIKLEQKCYITF